jgi:hypothetical protein
MRPAWFSATSPASLHSPPTPPAEAIAELAASLHKHTVASGPKGALPPVPYPLMWADDAHWFPLLVARRRFVGRADFARADGVGAQAYAMRRFWFGAEANADDK